MDWWFFLDLSFPADNAFSSCTLWATSRIRRRSLHQASALRWDLGCNICDGLFSGLSAMLEPRYEIRIIYIYKDIQKEISLIQVVIMVDDNFRCHQRLKMLSMEFGKRAQQTGGSRKTVFYQLAREIFGAMDANISHCFRVFSQMGGRAQSCHQPAGHQSPPVHAAGPQ